MRRKGSKNKYRISLSLHFGKYRDWDIEDIPDSYLIWLLGTDWFEKRFPDLVKPVDDELKYRRKWNIRIQENGSRTERPNDENGED